ncbi:MAG: hypothetical protein QOF53_2220, partial [Nocardioidaceae bacterium]|nr:hypothetical protein [Nocardioidaceae bacterium]
LPSRGWRWVVWSAGVDCVAVVLLQLVTPGPLDSVSVPLTANPLGLPLSDWPTTVLNSVLTAGLSLALLAAAASIVVRFRRSAGVERLQLKWLMSAEVTIAVMFCLLPMLRTSAPDGPGAVLLNATYPVALSTFSLVPVAIGIAITRYGLYGIDRLISRALVVGALSVFIGAVYVGIVVGVGSLAGSHQPSTLLSVLATAVVAVAFQPVREAVTAGANRLVYGSRATPYEVLADFAADMAGTFTTAELLPRITQTVSQSLDDATVEVWLVTGTGLERAGRWPADDRRDASRVSLGGIDMLQGDRMVPVRHRDELLGALTVTRSSGEPVTPTEEELLVHVASQTGLVLRNLLLVQDLQSSRERLVSMQDRQRRRLERDLHDGAQQSLVAITLILRMASQQDDPDALAAAATSASEQLQTAVAELRELARGLHPAILTERGTAAALRGLAERCPVPVRVDSTLTHRLPGPVEGALYFVAAESLTNVARYARARSAQVVLRDHGTSVSLEVADDGVGGADPTRGTGLLGLGDRVAVVDGSFHVDSPPGGGTRIRCVVPLTAQVALPRQRSWHDHAPQPARSPS